MLAYHADSSGRLVSVRSASAQLSSSRTADHAGAPGNPIAITRKRRFKTAFIDFNNFARIFVITGGNRLGAGYAGQNVIIREQGS
jgi:hypothetical protein